MGKVATIEWNWPFTITLRRLPGAAGGETNAVAAMLRGRSSAHAGAAAPATACAHE